MPCSSGYCHGDGQRERRGEGRLLADIYVDYHAVMPETRKTFGDISVWPSGDLVATVEIGRPPDNFFDAGLITSLADALAWLDEQPEFRAAVLCSDGKHFCAGADFTGRSGRPGMGGAKELYAAAARLFEAQTPVVAAVQGAAVGGGLGLACAADFRVASPQARFSANFARLGLHHGFALTVTLPAIIGEQRALDLLCTGRRVGGEEAARIGLADRLAEPEDPEGLRAAAQELAAEIAAAAPLAVRSIRATMRGTLADRARMAMDRELAEQDRLRQTADFAEGIRASARRRPPRFEAR
jgi:2-(1,2-epoxy-1,2-dihydrophenyl)acetyl-CoA isomerase